MKCLNCEFDNPESVKYCGQCGARLTRICPRCLSSNRAELHSCSQCGHDLEQTKAAPAVDYSEPESYTPKLLADKILVSHTYIEGERKLVTILFADVANFTSISEKLDAEDLHVIMNRCFQILMKEIHRFEGTIDKFTGDGLMALFGAPLAHEDHAQRACYAALAIQEVLREFGRNIKKEFMVEFKMRLGINSGPVVVGSIGNNLRMDYTAIGDTTNLASRIENLARPGTVLVSADTYRITKDFFKFSFAGKVGVKGKKAPVETYQLIAASGIETRFDVAVTKGLTRFVGRDEEMEVLKAAFEKVRSGSGQVVGIVGEAGVGKSRLLLELKQAIPGDEYAYLKGRCLHYGVSMAYLPFLDILRLYFTLEEGERQPAIKKKLKAKIDQLNPELRDILPPLHDILSLAIDNEEYAKLDPPQKRVRTFDAIRNLLVREGQNRPLVLAIEDIHWIDKTSEELLTHLIGWMADTRILMILLYRPEYTHSWGDTTCYSQITLNELSSDVSTELVHSVLPDGQVAPDLKELVLSRAGGNPLFMEELIRTLQDHSYIHRGDGEYLLSVNASDIQVPDTVQGIIAARIDRVEDNLKHIMQVASVIGRDFAFPILQIITGMQNELKSNLLDLQVLEFIYEKRNFPELEYIFKHALIQEVAYNSLLLRRSRKLHERVGQAIEILYADRLEELFEVLAHHYSRSQNLEKAYHYLRLSGDKASRSYSNWEAFRFYEETIGVLNRFPDTEENRRNKIDVRLLMEGPMRLLGFPGDSLAILQEGEKLSKEIGDEKSLAIFYSILGFYYSVRGDALLGRKYAENGFQEALKVEDIDLAAPIAFDLCAAYNISGEFQKIVEVAPRVLALLEKTRRESEFFSRPFNFNLYSAICAYYGRSMGWLGNFREGQAQCEKGLRFAREINNIYSIGWAEFMCGFFFNTYGDGRRAVDHFERSIKYLEEGQLFLILGLAWAGLGWGYYFAGDLETAREYTEKGIKIHTDVGNPVLLSQLYVYLGMIQLDSPDVPMALKSIEQALDLSLTRNEKYSEGMARILLGRAYGKGEKPQYEQAKEHIIHGIRIMEELSVKPYFSVGHLFLGELLADAGRHEESLEHLRRAEKLFGEMGMKYWSGRTQGVLETMHR